MDAETEVMKNVENVNQDSSLKKAIIKKRGRPLKIKRGRPKRIMFPELPKPPLLKISSGCCVNGCTSTDKWMYTLPEEDSLKEHWLAFLSRPGWNSDRKSRVCEVHFERQMWRNTRDGQRTLRPDAFPTLNESESWDGVNGDIHFVDVLNFEESEVFVKSELLEPEIDMAEEPEFSPSSPVATKTMETLKEETDAQFPKIKLELLYGVKAEEVVPDVEDPPNTMETTTNLECENSSVTSNDPLSFHVEEEKGYRCPLCMKHLARKTSLKYHLEKNHPDDETAEQMVIDLKTRFKFRRKSEIIKEWSTKFPDIMFSFSNVPSLLPLSPDESLAAHSIPLISESAVLSENNPSVENLVPDSPELQTNPWKNNQKATWKDQLECETRRKTVLSIQLPQARLRTDSALSSQQLNGSIDTNKKLKCKDIDASTFMFCASLDSLSVEKRVTMKKKLMDLVNAVLNKNLDPEKIIIAYAP